MWEGRPLSCEGVVPASFPSALHPYGDQTERKREGREGRRGQQQWQHTGSCENPVLGDMEGAGWGKWECDLISLYTCTKFLRIKKIYVTKLHSTDVCT